MDLGLAGKAALVTGAGRGIGAAIARELAHEGCDVAIVEHHAFDEATKLAAEFGTLGRHAVAMRASVVDVAGAERVVADVVRHLGRLDFMVCNAGITRDAPIWKMTEAQWDEVLDVNLKGCWAYCRAVAPLFREQRRGRVVNIASINGIRGKFGQSNYAASKAGVISLTKSLARELGGRGINVNCVAPGMIRTQMATSLPKEILNGAIAESALGRIGEPEDVARVVAFLCSDAARHITGEVIKIDGGQYI